MNKLISPHLTATDKIMLPQSTDKQIMVSVKIKKPPINTHTFADLSIENSLNGWSQLTTIEIGPEPRYNM